MSLRTISSITLTGAGMTTDMHELSLLSKSYSQISVEWGVLYSPERAGKDNRYPTIEWIQNFAQFAREHRLRIALHVCGRGVDEMLLDAKRATQLTRGYQRVQLNFNQNDRQMDLRHVDQLIRTLARPVITQHNDANDSLSRLLTSPHHQLLVDSSLGRGITPSTWPAPIALKPTGYAGGLGPANLAASLVQIDAVAGSEVRRSWVDMESRLFTSSNLFSLERCRQAADVLDAHVSLRRSEPEPDALIPSP